MIAAAPPKPLRARRAPVVTRTATTGAPGQTKHFCSPSGTAEVPNTTTTKGGGNPMNRQFRTITVHPHSVDLATTDDLLDRLYNLEAGAKLTMHRSSTGHVVAELHDAGHHIQAWAVEVDE